MRKGYETYGVVLNDLADVLDVIRIYIIRRRIIGLTQSENKVFPSMVNKIQEIINADNKRAMMFRMVANNENRARLPNDLEVARYLESAYFYSPNYCKYILALIEEQITGSRPDMQDTKLQIEHIMPQKLTAEWRMSLGKNAEEIHQGLVHTIGNMTLIRQNQEVGQKPFWEKRKVYDVRTSLQIAKTMITNNRQWNENSIRNRTKWIIRYLLDEVIPIPEHMRKTNNFAIKDKKRGLSFTSMRLIGEDIDFIEDPNITARVIGDQEVAFEGRKWRLTSLTREIQARRGERVTSKHYQGSEYWEYDGTRLADIVND